MNKTQHKLTIVAFLCVINIIGSFIAATLKLPIYLDSMGSILSGFLFGPAYGMLCGVGSAIISGVAFDPYSFYFMSVQIVLGALSGFLYNKNLFNGKKVFLGSFFLSVPASIVAAVIAAFVFGGVTSSGSSYIVQLLTKMGLGMGVSVFITQVFTDYADKLVSVLAMLKMSQHIPEYIKNMYEDTKHVS